MSRQSGVVIAETLADFEDLIRLFVRLDGRKPGGRRLAVLSNAGFECVAAADNLGGFEPTKLSSTLRNKLEILLKESKLESIVNVRNPLDLTPMAGAGDVRGGDPKPSGLSRNRLPRRGICPHDAQSRH